jgi:hypothetical protein
MANKLSEIISLVLSNVFPGSRGVNTLKCKHTTMAGIVKLLVSRYVFPRIR